MKQRNMLKLSAATFVMIGTGMILFHSAAEMTLAAKYKKMEKIPTSYQVSDNLDTTRPKSVKKGEGGKKASYSVSMDSLNTGTPTDTDLTMKEAAEAGAEYLRHIYGLDLEGAYVYMSYDSGTQTFPRAFWAGDVLFEKEQTPESTRWTYMIDAVTGELFNICYGRQLEVSVPLGYDAALEKDYRIYAKLAKKKVEEWKLVDEPVDKVEYNCQGYSGNDPTISVDVISKSGKIVNMTFSRYDQTFLGAITDTSRKVSESVLDSILGDAEDLNAQSMGAEK